MPDVPQGIQHRHRDYYSENSPIPSVQRFFKKGLAEVIAKRNRPESESESEDDQLDQDIGIGGAPLPQLPNESASRTSTAPEHQSTQTQEKPSRKERLSSLFSGSRGSQDSKSSADSAPDAAHANDNSEEEPNQAHRSPEEVDKAYKRSRKPRKVKDPVTGRVTWIHDIGKREYRNTLKRAEAGDNLGREEVLRSNIQNNLTSKAFPPSHPVPSSVFSIDRRLLPFFAAWAALTVFGWIPRLLSVALNAWLLWWGWRRFLSGAEDHRWHRERLRGEQARSFDDFEQDEKEQSQSQGLAEGAEWLNGIVEALWSVMNPELFSSLGGTLEDVMQASIPGFIHAVKVEDLAQGSTPIRITGLRILPDEHVESLQTGMRKERLKRRQQNKQVDLPVDKKGSVLTGQPQAGAEESQGQHGQREQEEKDEDEEEKGEHYVNLELGLVYRARPTSNGVGGKSRNAHLLIKFWIGARKLLMLPLPVWVEIKGFVGRVRARVQLTSDPPFVKNITITFCGLPRVGIEVVPMHINTAHIPFISSFIESSIDAALGEFVMPSSLTTDVGEILMGDNIKREVNAVGVVVVHIHSATDLEKQDVRGSSDPYCTLSLAKVGKILYSTRVVLNDLCPRWEERHVILVTREHLDNDDKVSIALWDSDRFSQDDMLGRAEINLVDLARHPNRLYKRSDTLKGLDRERTKQGIVHWSLGFFKKAPAMRAEQRERKEEASASTDSSGPERIQGADGSNGKDGAATAVEKGADDRAQNEKDDVSVRDGKELEDDSVEEGSPLSEQSINREKKTQTRNQATDVDFEPPNPSLPSGILSMQIHQIANLEVVDRHQPKRPRKKDEPGQDVDTVETEDDPEHAPSAYCRIILNDEIIFQTRTKALNSNPFFNAGTERFVRDWRRTLIMVVVYDYRVREADAILGVVPIKLSDLFRNSSQITQFFPLAGGVGHGRIRMSLLFRPIDHMTRFKNKLGWNIGTVRLLASPVATDFDESKGASGHDVHLVALRASTLAGTAKIHANRARYVDESKAAVEWKLSEEELPLKVPARRRYAAPYVIEFRGLSALGKRKTTHMCIVWLQDVPDDDVIDLALPIWRPQQGKDFHRLRQNYHHYENEAEAEKLGVERMGYLHVKLQFKSGLGKIHTKFDNNAGAKVVMDAWRCCIALGLRSVSGDFANSRTNTAGYLEDVDEKDRHSDPGQTDSDTDDEEDGSEADANDPNAGLQRSRSLKEKISEWKADKHELHRQHKGIQQYKPVRTLSWLGQTAKSAGAGLKDKFDIQDRRSQHIETEL